MLYDLEAVRDNIRNRDGQRVYYLGKGDQLTSRARDYLQQARIPILPAAEAKPHRFRLEGGGFMEEKPEHMTHLSGDILVSKTHPRILFRGAMDTLEGLLLLCQLKVPRWEKELGEILALARKVLSCEVLNEPLPETPLCGLTRDQLRQHSHRPQDYYSQPHFMPEKEDGEGVLQLNRVRCAVRAAELQAVAAVPDRQDLLQAMNRMSSMVYILMIRQKAEKNGR